jgi:AraC-like DNA-binding protein
VKWEHINQEFSYRDFRHFVVATVVSDELTVAHCYSVVADLKERFATAEIYTTSVLNRAHNLFIIMDEQPIDTILVKAEVLLAVREISGKEGEVKVGEVVHDIGDIRNSYQSSLMEHQGEMGTVSGFSGEGYPTKIVHDFLQYIYIGDESNALQMLDVIDNYYASRKYRAGHRQYYDYKLLSVYLQGMKENMIELPTEEIDGLLAFRNHTNLFELLRESASRCCSRIQAATEQTNLDMQKKLLQYVNEHMTDIGLCLSSAADELNTSIYVVSRLFKEGFGVGFKEYVISKRLEMARELLIATNHSVMEVARAAGFENATYFSTAFRKNFGLSPSKYREQYRDSEK